MIYPHVHLIAAVGRSGQLGLGGTLPWPQAKGDLKWFKEMTVGDVVIFGRATVVAQPHLLSLPKRTILIDDTDLPAAIAMRKVAVEYHNRRIWVAGGAKTYRRLLRFCSRSYITTVDYDGPADVFFPFDEYRSLKA